MSAMACQWQVTHAQDINAEHYIFTAGSWKRGYPRKVESRVILEAGDAPIFGRFIGIGTADMRLNHDGEGYEGVFLMSWAVDAITDSRQITPQEAYSASDPLFDREQISAMDSSALKAAYGNNANDSSVTAVRNCKNAEGYPVLRPSQIQWIENGIKHSITRNDLLVFCTECDVRDKSGKWSRQEVTVTCAYKEGKEIKTPEEAFAAEPHTIDFPKIIAEYHQRNGK